jgi:hypothetical protein
MVVAPAPFCSNYAYSNRYTQVEQRKDLGSKCLIINGIQTDTLSVDVALSKMTGRNIRSAEQLNC